MIALTEAQLSAAFDVLWVALDGTPRPDCILVSRPWAREAARLAGKTMLRGARARGARGRKRMLTAR